MTQVSQHHTSASAGRRPRVFMFDLWATVPYYTAFLSRALLAEGVDLQIGSITYYLDRSCFKSRNLKLDPGLLNVVGRFHLPGPLRRVLKLAEGVLNLAALAIRFTFRAPDIVHVQYLPMLRSRLPIDAWFVWFCQRRGAKIVLTVHDLLPHDTADKFTQPFARLYARVDALICHSDHIKERLQTEFGIPSSKIAIIPHGPFFYDLPASDTTAAQQLGLPSGHTFALWQGIIFPYKGLDLLLNAWKQVEAQTTHFDLVVLGTGSPELTHSLENQARELGLQRVHFNFRFASVEELAAAYRAAQIVIYPYRAITTSGALATGLALGKPIIASNLPVFRELLTNEKDALLVDPEQPAALAAAILRLFNDHTLREQFAEAVRAKDLGARSWEQIASQTASFYAAVLATSTTNPPTP